jgi:hypothetical protein
MILDKVSRNDIALWWYQMAASSTIHIRGQENP